MDANQPHELAQILGTVDASFLDIRVRGVDLSLWERLLTMVPRVSSWYAYQVDGQVEPLPRALAAFRTAQVKPSSLQFRLRDGVDISLAFNSSQGIELWCSRRRAQEASAVLGLESFLVMLAQELGRDVVVRADATVLVRYSPHTPLATS